MFILIRRRSMQFFVYPVLSLTLLIPYQDTADLIPYLDTADTPYTLPRYSWYFSYPT